jgi:hypothetical protein
MSSSDRKIPLSTNYDLITKWAIKITKVKGNVKGKDHVGSVIVRKYFQIHTKYQLKMQ